MQQTGGDAIATEEFTAPRPALDPVHQGLPTLPGGELHTVDLGDLLKQGLFVTGHDILGEIVMMPA
jgi:hypothetical protein